MLGEKEHRAAIRWYADVLESREEIRGLGRDDEIAGKRQAEPDAGGRSAHRRDHRFLQAMQLDDHLLMSLGALAPGGDVVHAPH